MAQNRTEQAGVQKRVATPVAFRQGATTQSAFRQEESRLAASRLAASRLATSGLAAANPRPAQARQRTSARSGQRAAAVAHREATRPAVWELVAEILGRRMRQIRAGAEAGGGWLLRQVGKRLRRRWARPADGQPVLRVVDQMAAGPKLRLLLVEADGQRVLVAASGDAMPALLPMPPKLRIKKQVRKQIETPSSRRKLQAEEAVQRVPQHLRARHESLREPMPGNAAAGKLTGWAAGAAAGSEIQ